MLAQGGGGYGGGIERARRGAFVEVQVETVVPGFDVADLETAVAEPFDSVGSMRPELGLASGLEGWVPGGRGRQSRGGSDGGGEGEDAVIPVGDPPGNGGLDAPDEGAAGVVEIDGGVDAGADVDAAQGEHAVEAEAGGAAGHGQTELDSPEPGWEMAEGEGAVGGDVGFVVEAGMEDRGVGSRTGVEPDQMVGAACVGRGDAARDRSPPLETQRWAGSQVEVGGVEFEVTVVGMGGDEGGVGQDRGDMEGAVGGDRRDDSAGGHEAALVEGEVGEGGEGDASVRRRGAVHGEQPSPETGVFVQEKGVVAGFVLGEERGKGGGVTFGQDENAGEGLTPDFEATFAFGGGQVGPHPGFVFRRRGRARVDRESRESRDGLPDGEPGQGIAGPGIQNATDEAGHDGRQGDGDLVGRLATHGNLPWFHVRGLDPDHEIFARDIGEQERAVGAGGGDSGGQDVPVGVAEVGVASVAEVGSQPFQGVHQVFMDADVKHSDGGAGHGAASIGYPATQRPGGSEVDGW